jgi:CDP-diacylglycerol--glycerol-3-phosphate 3-phosphatidyltransferase
MLIFLNRYQTGLALFILVVLTDSIDGALARTRGQITSLGLVLDPLADKLLIGGTLLIFMSRYPFPELIFYLILFELTVIITGYIWINILKRPAVPANIWGKIKMTCQSVATVFIFIWVIFHSIFWLYLSALLLILALLFTIMSALYPLTRKKRK